MVDKTVSRRKAFGMAGRFAAAIAFAFARRPWSEAEPEPVKKLLGDVPKSLGPDRLRLEPSDIAWSFAQARSGELMVQYQTFWKLKPDELIQLEGVSADLLKEAKGHRLIALPSVAYLHALPELDRKEDVDRAFSVISKAHTDAKDVRPNREILEIIWQNVLASLIRNEDHWRTLRLPRELITQAEQLCMSYLRGEDLLFSPALLAFHALLTYQRALEWRQVREGTLVESVLERILATADRSRVPWFARIVELLSSRRGFEESIPQLSEVLMGHLAFPEAISDFALLSRLHVTAQISRVAEGRTESAFTSRERAIEAKDVLIGFLNDYVFSVRDWMGFRPAVDRWLGRDELTALTAAFENYRRQGGVDASSGAREVAKTVPVARFDEQTLPQRAGINPTELASRIAVGTPTLAALVPALWPISRQALSMLEIEDVDKLRPTEIERIIIEEGKVDVSKPLARLAADLEDVRLSTRSIIGWTPNLTAKQLPLVRSTQEVRAKGHTKRANESPRVANLGHPAGSVGVAARRPYRGEFTAMPNDVEDLGRLVSIVQNGINAVSEKAPEVMADFFAAFSERSTVPGLDEAQGTEKGLRDVLSSLLQMSPPVEVLAAYRKLSKAAPDGQREQVTLKDEMLTAVGGLATYSPATLRLFDENIKQKKISPNVAVGALLVLYTKKKNAYPF